MLALSLIFLLLTTVHCLNLNKKITDETENGGVKSVEIMVTLKYLTDFWITLEMPFINCQINFILTWSDKWVLSNDIKATAFTISQ